MDNILNLSFKGADEVRELFSESGVGDNGQRVRITLEASMTEINEEGAMLVPDTVEVVETIEEDAPDAGGAGVETALSGEDVPGMVLVLGGKGKKKPDEMMDA